MHQSYSPFSGPDFGVEEEYFLVDPLTRDIPPCPPEGFFAACTNEFSEQVSIEMFKSQIELVTPVLHQLDHAREHLCEGRRRLIALAREFGLSVVCVGAHPFADWREQVACEDGSYPQLFEDHQMVAQRSLLSGLHVHVGIPEERDRIEVMNRVVRWLPLLLALSSASPFWVARNTGLKSYRQALCGEWPRMGLPEHFANEAAFKTYTQRLVSAGAIRKPSDIWWAIRPSARYPTLELRIADACPLVEDALCIVGLFRGLIAHALEQHDAPVDDHYQRLGTAENYWRARRFGVAGEFLDDQGMTLVGLGTWLDQAEALLSERFVEPWIFTRARQILREGSSADRQLAVFRQALDRGQTPPAGLAQVVDSLVEETARPAA